MQVTRWAKHWALFRVRPPAIRMHVHGFTSLGIGSNLAASLVDKGLSPSPIQSQAVPAILAGRNCALQSHTGSGKTLAYLLPALTRALAERSKPGFKYKSVLALVAAPSRELCMQILRTAQQLLPKDQQQDAQQLIGGANPKRQHEALRRNRPALVVGTPGRLLDMISSGALHVSHCPLLILDEVDVLAGPELYSETSRVVAAMGKQLDTPRQTVLVSASLSPQLVKSLEGWCPGAQYLSTHSSAGAAAPAAAPAGTGSEPAPAGRASGSEHDAAAAGGSDDGQHSHQSRARLILPPGLQHYYVVCGQGESLDYLARSINALGVQRAMIFSGSKTNAMMVKDVLNAKRLQATVFHSLLTKLERTNILNAFGRGVFRAIVVTDLASRGLNFPEIDAVFNLGVPEDEVDYAHRAGRTNRMGGAEGKVVSIISSKDLPRIERTSRRLGIQIQPASTSFGQFVSGGQVLFTSSPGADTGRQDSSSVRSPPL